MFFTVISLKYALLASQWPYHTHTFINQWIERYLNNTINLHPLTPHIMPRYTHKGDGIMAIDSVTSLHPVYNTAWRQDGILASWNYCWRLTEQQREAWAANPSQIHDHDIMVSWQSPRTARVMCFVEITTVRHAVSEVLACIVIKRTKVLQRCTITEGVLVLNTGTKTQFISTICVNVYASPHLETHTHTHTHLFNGFFSGTAQVSRHQKGKANLDFTEARDSEWQWHQLGHKQVCISLQRDNHASTPPVKFFTGRMPFLPPKQQRQSSTNYCKTVSSTTTSKYWIKSMKKCNIFAQVV